MQIFVFEFVTGGGWRLVDEAHAPSGSLLREGRAMVEAVVADFAAIDSVTVLTLTDQRLHGSLRTCGENTFIKSADELDKQFTRAATQADFTLVIAPEFDGHLARFAAQVECADGRLISPSPDFIRLTSDKQATAEHLESNAVPAPRGIRLEGGQRIPLGAARDVRLKFESPAIVKPVDGAGSIGIRMLSDDATGRKFSTAEAASRIETFHAGIPASVAAICSPLGPTLLPPCHQRLSDDGRFSYLGGSCPIEERLAQRASRLARQALAALPRTTGYVGIDMVLGVDPAGDSDVVIEVNPRLTTSYVGLRELVEQNLAEVMLQAAQSRAIELSVRSGRVEFSADGTVHNLAE